MSKYMNRYTPLLLLLAACCSSTAVVAQDAARTPEWFAEIRRLAAQGDADWQVIVGGMYGEGVGVEKNDIEAVKWYRLAAEQGNASAQNNLGVLYDNGVGVAENDAEAVKWFRRAADQGNARAQSADPQQSLRRPCSRAAPSAVDRCGSDNRRTHKATDDVPLVCVAPHSLVA